MRKQGQGLLVTAKAGMDGLAVLYARKLALWGIETAIIVPGALTKGTNYFAHAGVPADKQRLAEYEAGPYKGYGKLMQSYPGGIENPGGFRRYRARQCLRWRCCESHREGC